jgi:putative transposase
MRAQEARHTIATMSRVLEVSRSGFYAWAGRSPSRHAREDAELVDRIRSIHEQSRGTYGAPRIHAELSASGRRIGRKRVARLMRANSIRGVSRRKWTTTTVRDRTAVVSPDLVKRDFRAQRPNQLWVADITYVPTWSRFLYVAVVLDAWSRRVVGWAFAMNLRVELVLAALEMAVRCRQPRAVIHHSDQGSQYTALAFGTRCRQAGVRPSMGSVGDAYDNAMCESFFATLECELIDRVRLRSPEEAEMAVFEFIEGWYNSRRRHSALDFQSPIEYESSHLGVTQDTSPDLSTETG